MLALPLIAGSCQLGLLPGQHRGPARQLPLGERAYEGGGAPEEDQGSAGKEPCI